MRWGDFILFYFIWFSFFSGSFIFYTFSAFGICSVAQRRNTWNDRLTCRRCLYFTLFILNAKTKPSCYKFSPSSLLFYPPLMSQISRRKSTDRRNQSTAHGFSPTENKDSGADGLRMLDNRNRKNATNSVGPIISANVLLS